MKWYQLSEKEILTKLHSDATAGLSCKEAKNRLAFYGLNTYESSQKSSFLKIFLQQFYNPLIMLLALSGGIIFFTEDAFDAYIILGIIILNTSIGAFQERRIQHIMQNLKRIKKRESTLIREGKQHVIEDTLLVPGDIIILQAGEHVSADIRILESYQTTANESLLSGESEPVAKYHHTLHEDLLITEQNNMLFSGSMILNGYVKGIIVATGKNTEEHAGKKHKDNTETSIPLQKDLNRLLQFILWFILFICISLFLIGYATGRSLPELFAALLALFMCVVPQGLPVIMTIILVAGAYAMARNALLIKQLQSLETLGRADVAIFDKTGTLTKNELMVISIVAGSNEYSVTGSGYHTQGKIVDIASTATESEASCQELHAMMEAALLLNRAMIDYNSEKKIFTIRGNTNEAALYVCAQKYGLSLESLQNIYKKIYEIPFNAQNQYHAGFYNKNGQGVLYVIGSVEAIFKRSKVINVTQKKQLNKLIEQGVRVLSVAFKHFDLADIPADQSHLFSYYESIIDDGLHHLGIFGIQDTLRDQASQVITQMKNAGIQVIMATGDTVKTASFIAHQAGILTGDQKIMESSEMHKLSDAELLKKISTTSVFARALPSDKSRLVSLLKTQQKIVLVIGDGINDIPALSHAHVSIVMGATGTESAKEVAHILLMEDAFEKIIDGIEYGRHIFYTFKRVILYFFTTNCAEVFVMLFALAGGFPVPLLASQILWLNLVTDGFLDTALSLEPLEDDLLHFSWMKEQGKLLTKSLLWQVLSVAFLASFFSCALFVWYLPRGLSYARTMAMVTLTCCQWVTALNCRSLKKSLFKLSIYANPWLLCALLGIVITQIGLLYIPFLQTIFKTVPIGIYDWTIIVSVGLILIIISEIHKRIKTTF